MQDNFREEMEELSPTLRKFKEKGAGFTVPADYFEGLTDQLSLQTWTVPPVPSAPADKQTKGKATNIGSGSNNGSTVFFNPSLRWDWQCRHPDNCCGVFSFCRKRRLRKMPPSPGSHLQKKKLPIMYRPILTILIQISSSGFSEMMLKKVFSQ